MVAVVNAPVAGGVRYAFISGHGPGAVQGSRHADAPVLAKPFGRSALALMLTQLASNR